MGKGNGGVGEWERDRAERSTNPGMAICGRQIMIRRFPLHAILPLTSSLFFLSFSARNSPMLRRNFAGRGSPRFLIWIGRLKRAFQQRSSRSNFARFSIERRN